MLSWQPSISLPTPSMATGTIRFHLIEKIIVQNELTELFMDEPLVSTGIKGIFSERRTAWLGREDLNLDMANCNRMLSPVREEPQNLFSLKLIGPSKR